MLKWMKASGSVITSKTLLKEMGAKFLSSLKSQTIKVI